MQHRGKKPADRSDGKSRKPEAHAVARVELNRRTRIVSEEIELAHAVERLLPPARILGFEPVFSIKGLRPVGKRRFFRETAIRIAHELDELIEKYGDVRYCEGMPGPDATSPAFLIWNPREKTPLVPYDVKEAIALNQQRGDLGTMFESEEDLTVFEEGTIGRDGLKMKHGSNIELMRATRNDMA